MQYPKSGPNSTAEYQVSGLPFATSSIAGTSSPVQIMFPFVTRFFTVKNTGTNYLAIGFTNNGVQGGEKFTLPPSGSYGNEHRVKDLFFLGVGGSTAFEVVAGLTMVERTMFPTLTGSGAAGVAAANANLSVWGYNPGLG